MLTDKDYLNEPSQFQPENLLREARRQKNINNCLVPEICVLDPDGDIVAYLLRTKQAKINTCWSCYHSIMHEYSCEDVKIGIIACAVGASYAVLLAEQLFVSGCKLLISITSAGIIQVPKNRNTEFLLIEESLRDEGTSYHYLPASAKASLNSNLIEKLFPLTINSDLHLEVGKSWTTDAPYRETVSAITQAKKYGAIAVEMEAAALYAFAKLKKNKVVCFAHLTNTMAREGDDFEKGLENGSLASLKLISETVNILQNQSDEL